MKNKYRQYKTSLVIGLLSCNTLSSCVNTQKVLGVKTEASMFIDQQRYDCSCTCMPRSMKNHNLPNNISNAFKGKDIDHYSHLFAQASSNKTFLGNDIVTTTKFPKSTDYQKQTGGIDCKNVLSNKPEKTPGLVNVFGDPIEYQRFQGMDIQKIAFEISNQSFDLKKLECWVKGNDYERLSLKMQDRDGETIPTLLLSYADSNKLSYYQLFKRLKILLKSKDFSWDHKDIGGRDFIYYLNLYLEDNPHFKGFSKKLLRLKK